MTLIMTVAPEIFLTQHYNLKVDVYSFAIVLHCMLSLARPFEKYNAQLHTLLVCKEGVRPPIPHEWPKELRDLLKYGWAHRPSDRPSIKEARFALERLAQRVVAEGVPPSSSSSSNSNYKNSDPLLLSSFRAAAGAACRPSSTSCMDRVSIHPLNQKAGKLLRKMEDQLIRGAVSAYPNTIIKTASTTSTTTTTTAATTTTTATARKEHPHYRKHLRSAYRL
jgi:hypothetical protein